MKFILTNTGNMDINKNFGLDRSYIIKLNALNIPYIIVDDKTYECVIDISLNDLILLSKNFGELIIAKNYYPTDIDDYPILEIYDDWRE